MYRLIDKVISILHLVILMINDVLEIFRKDPELSKKVEFIKEIPPKEGKYDYLNELNPLLIDYLNSKNIKLYKHQCQVTNLIREGKNVIITTPTASGKTFAFTLPVLEKFANDQKATALYLYPAKALSNDQLEKFKEYELETGIKLDPYIYDGDTPDGKKTLIRRKARALLSNPHMLHLILDWHKQWERFYSNLEYVILDEAHTYTGLFGSNVALLLRRFQRICSYYGSDPRYILSSATLDNPVEFSEKLVGKKFELVSDDHSINAKKSFIFYNPHKKLDKKEDTDSPEKEENLITNEDVSSSHDTRKIFAMLLLNDLQTLCFTRTKKKAESIANTTINYLRDYLTTNENLKHKNGYKPLWERVYSYRGQYSPFIREKIEKNLKSRTYLGVVTTNALELGIDIGSLDAVIISSYPGTLISTWQQAGRAGRKNKESLVILIAEKDPLNQYIIKNPDYLLNNSPENAVVDLSNDYVNSNHIKCAASEIPITMNELKELFSFTKPVEYLEKLGLKNVNGNWKYFGNPAHDFQLKKFGDENFTIIYENERFDERISREEFYLLGYKEATHQYRKSTYVVTDFDLKGKTVRMRKTKLGSCFSSRKEDSLKILDTIKTKKIGLLDVHFGSLLITSEFFKFEYRDGKPHNREKIKVPSVIFETKGIWINIPNNILYDPYFFENDDYDETSKAVYGLGHSLTAMFPLYVLCDRCDVKGFSTEHHEDTGTASIFIYDTYQGGMGLSERGLDFFENLLKLTLDMVEKCECEDGCVHCIHSPLCNVDRKPRSKSGTIFLLKKLLEYCEKTSDSQGSDSNIIINEDSKTTPTNPVMYGDPKII